MKYLLLMMFCLCSLTSQAQFIFSYWGTQIEYYPNDPLCPNKVAVYIDNSRYCVTKNQAGYQMVRFMTETKFTGTSWKRTISGTKYQMTKDIQEFGNIFSIYINGVMKKRGTFAQCRSVFLVSITSKL